MQATAADESSTAPAVDQRSVAGLASNEPDCVSLSDTQQLVVQAHETLARWQPLSDCVIIAQGGLQFSFHKIILARHSRVLRKVINEFPAHAIFDMDDPPAALAAFVLWAHDTELPLKMLEAPTPLPASLLGLAAKWDMPQLRNFCIGVAVLWEVTEENLQYCQTLAVDHDLKLLQDACSKFECGRQEAEDNAARRAAAAAAGEFWHQPLFGCNTSPEVCAASSANLNRAPCLFYTISRALNPDEPICALLLSTLCLLLPVASGVLLGEQRAAVRAKYGLRSLAGGPPPAKRGNGGCALDECAAAIMCGPCAFVQLTAELEHRGLIPRAFEPPRDAAAAPDAPPLQQQMIP